jgi:hypothetical protein
MTEAEEMDLYGDSRSSFEAYSFQLSVATVRREHGSKITGGMIEIATLVNYHFARMKRLEVKPETDV